MTVRLVRRPAASLASLLAATALFVACAPGGTGLDDAGLAGGAAADRPPVSQIDHVPDLADAAGSPGLDGVVGSTGHDRAAPDPGPDGAVASPDGTAGDTGAADTAPPPPDAPGQPDPALQEQHDRADHALETLLLHYFSQPLHYLASVYPSDGHATGYWTFAQALDAVLDAVERTSGRRFAGTARTLVAQQTAIGFRRDFFDDENWMALALLRKHHLLGDADDATAARRLMDDIRSNAWDTQGCGGPGNYWDRNHTQKATAANGGPVITAVRVAALTGDGSYLDYARQLYQAWTALAVDPVTHAVADHVDCRTGQLVHWRYTYNEALMIGAAMSLHQATGEATYLDDARAIAAHMIESEVTPSPLGPVLFDGPSSHCGPDCAQFKGIGYRYLDAFLGADPDGPQAGAAQALLDTSAQAVWQLARDPGAGLFGVDWSQPPAGAPFLISAQSSAAMALSLAAARLGPYPVAPDAGQQTLEAEESVLHGLGLEASHAGFSGFGYVAGWNADGQWVDFHLERSAAGTYPARLRYAAAGGQAKRLIYVNGHNVVDAQAFPATTAWDHYNEIAVDLPLQAGSNTVSVIFNGSLGSTAYLNLDRMTVSTHPR
jgi:predicted alpha-1,6-mannanase (GH76 family)